MQKFKIVFIAAILLVAMIITANVVNKVEYKSSKNTSMTKIPDDYKTLWKKVDSLSDIAMAKQALEKVEEIYAKAKKENNHPEWVKSLIYKVKLTDMREEEAVSKSILQLEEETKTTPSPVKQILHSMTAQLYWDFYIMHRSEFLNRSIVETEANPTNLLTWDLKKITQKCIDHYKYSLEKESDLKDTKVEKFEAIVEEAYNSKLFRPTLYDFLAHRALDFFENSESGLTQPADKFELYENNVYDIAENFAKIDFKTNDTISFTYQATVLYQKLIQFHLNDKSPEALINLDLQRLSFVKAKSIVENSDSLYMTALNYLDKKYEKNPYVVNVRYEIASIIKEEGELYDAFNPVTQSKRMLLKKAYMIAENAINAYPQAIGIENCSALISSLKTKSITIQSEEAIAPNNPFKVFVKYKNVNKLYFKIVKIEENYLNYLNNGYYERENKIKKFIKKTAVQEFEVDLKDEKDYQFHTTECKINALPHGFYIVIASPNKNFEFDHNLMSFTNIWITNLSFTTRTKENGDLQVCVLDRITGNPLKAVDVQTYYSQYNYKLSKYENKKGASYVTDSNGFVSIPPQKNSYSDYFYLDISKNDDRVVTDKSFYVYKPYNDDQVRNNIYLFTDRAIYRPGQTVYFKGFAIQSKKDSSSILPDYSSNVTFYDVNSQVVEQLNVRTNEFGTFSGSFVIPTGLLTGRMTLYTTYGSKQFSVEEYKRPKFEVKIDKVKSQFKLNDVIKVTGNAKTYSGVNVDNTKVKYRVERKVYFRYWYWWYDFYAKKSSMEITNGETTTDATGNFTVNFKAIPDKTYRKEDNPVFQYFLYADVTDLNGETRSANSKVSVGYNAMELDLDIPDEVNALESEEYIVKSQNFDGEVVNAEVNIQVFELEKPNGLLLPKKWGRNDFPMIDKAEYAKLFPNEVYDNENNFENWKIKTKVFEQKIATKDKKKLVLKEINKWKQGKYVVEASAIDSFGNPVKLKKYFTLINEKSEDIVLPELGNVYVLSDNILEPGDTAEILVNSAADNVNALIELEFAGKIIKSSWVNLEKGKYKFKIPIVEKYRGNIISHVIFVRHNRTYAWSSVFNVPFSNKDLHLEFESFRDKLLPGQQEEWKIKIKGPKAEKIVAEMMATLYDASLDAFKPHSYYMSLYNYNSAQRNWDMQNLFEIKNFDALDYEFNPYSYGYNQDYDKLNWFGWYLSYYRYNYYGYDYAVNKTVRRSKNGGGKNKKTAVPPSPSVTGQAKSEEFDEVVKEETIVSDEFEKKDKLKDQEDNDKREEKPSDEIQVRKNFNETAFFMPHLKTNENGEIIVSFTIPEALTKWKFMGLAHTKDLKIGTLIKETVTQKTLMVVPNAPRFIREGDELDFTVKIQNVSAEVLNGTATLKLFDALSMKEVKTEFGLINEDNTFTVQPSASTMVNWKLKIPSGVQALTYRIIAKAGNYSDGEESTIPVLTNRMLVTETMPIFVNSNSTKVFSFDKLKNSGESSTLRHHALTLEFTPNPAWYAIQALPYLMEYPYECNEQTFSRFYANSIATHIVNSKPKIKAVFEKWQNQSPEAFLSNLEKNQELKTLLLEETPWVLQAQSESQRKKNVAILFDLKRMSNELNAALTKLEKAQVSNGAWPWFKGMPESRYITQHIVSGMAHLHVLGIKDLKDNRKSWKMIEKAIGYLDKQIDEDYDYIKKHYAKTMDDNHTSYMQIQYLYARSVFVNDIEISKNNTEAVNYFKSQVTKYWTSYNNYMQSMIALAMHRFGDKKLPALIIASLKDRALHSEEMGMYWKNTRSYWWYDSQIETQAMLIEAFKVVSNDTVAVDEMKRWLLKQKQTQDWTTTKATVEACYALLLHGGDWLSEDSKVVINIGNEVFDLEKMKDKVEPGTGYFKNKWTGSEVKPEMGTVKLTKKDKGVSWGGIYWQYFENLDKITMHETPLKINKGLFVEKNTATGPVLEPISNKTILKVGDKVKVRVEITVDRDMEYVHLKDMRASCFEPVNVISQCKYQNGLYYYEATKDASTNFFFHYLPKGTFVFEYPVFVTHKGDFSNGITTAQCMYAPEFSAHSEGIRVKVIE